MSAQRQAEPNGTPDWDRLRDEFPATGQYAYLDIGRKALLPRARSTGQEGACVVAALLGRKKEGGDC